MPGEVSAGAKHRQLAGQIRQVSTLCGPGMVITMTKAGAFYLDEIPAPTYTDCEKRFYTSEWQRPPKGPGSADLRSM